MLLGSATGTVPANVEFSNLFRTCQQTSFFGRYHLIEKDSYARHICVKGQRLVLCEIVRSARKTAREPGEILLYVEGVWVASKNTEK